MLSPWRIRRSRLGSCDITLVPSVHYAYPFAVEVNRLCRGARFDAIAVELTQEVAEAARRFILGLKPDAATGKVSLPLMVGVANRPLGPSVADPDAGNIGVAPLTPTDSIIEALRCGVELDIPVFGVDLGGYVHPGSESVFIGDGYLSPGLKSAPGPARLPVSDAVKAANEERDAFMAMNLAELSACCSRLLFVCGAAHVSGVLRHLMQPDPTLDPSALAKAQSLSSAASLCVLDKSIAALHISLFPFVATLYESWRRPASCAGPRRRLSLERIRRHALHTLARHRRDYFILRTDPSIGEPTLSTDAARYERFKDTASLYHANLGRMAMDLGGMLKTASSMMSAEFTESLAAFLMDVPWISQDEYRDLPRLGPSSGVVTKREEQGALSRCSEIPSDQDSGMVRSRVFFHTWHPWERFVLAKCEEAFNSAAKLHEVKRSVPFQGDFFDGVDFKATSRAAAKGRDEIHVHRRERKEREGEPLLKDGYPFVWIFDDILDRKADWQFFFNHLDRSLPYARNKKDFASLIKTKGNDLVTIVGPSVWLDSKGPSIHSLRFFGYVQFCPIFWSDVQFARWVEIGKARRNPLVDGFDNNQAVLQDACAALGKTQAQMDWRDVLAAVALRYATKAMTVVRGSAYRMDNDVRAAAKNRNIAILEVDIERFGKEDRKRLATCHGAPAKDYRSLAIFDEEVEKTMGEKQTALEELVPLAWRSYGRY